ncbi:MAG TPA: BrnT family toxin [Rhodocyclaceae bacterium]|nr:BrnT family toxin [Rhodocyclaceae bacterium]
MNYEHDPKKLAENVAKHGVWFHEATGFEWDTATIKHDSRQCYEETRFEAAGLIGTRLYILIFCFRETKIRIISLRKANSREVKRYACQN